MRYIDSASRNTSDVLGDWLASFNPQAVDALRWQTGYFSADGLAPLVPVLNELKAQDRLTNCVIGSNGGETGEPDIEALVNLVGNPRTNAKIGVVSFSAGLFHPKVYHFTRQDGSQAAYVGSANLTTPGISGMNIEAGLLLDSSAGDPANVLTDVAAAIDAWFNGTRPGLSTVSSLADLAPLVAAGILGVAPTPRTMQSSSTSSGAATSKVGLKPLIKFPPVSVKSSTAPAGATSAGTPSAAAPSAPPGAATATVGPLASSPRSPFPPYILFAPSIATPTQGAAALTGSTLAGSAAGLVIRLSRDSARLFSGGSGTANVSVPVATIGTIRFGVFGKYQRPRAEFDLRMRHVSNLGGHEVPASSTNVMAYGYAPGEPGHRDVRMLMPAPPARAIREHAAAHGLHVPTANDPMILEWPTPADPVFKATFIDPAEPLFATVDGMLTAASTSGVLVGKGACWLPAGISPQW
ncbi:phospholipase D family protein [Paracoccus shanxieyensis]|uniref:NgoFVII family restriction endonuclease n=1 Tax=Paracoccus shanxieyensis TaxID=2675752 RepID=A0A6L6J0J4_9RHOB|nr:phospholipase D family protein [Paracoccus shanxieyensis]MTH66295.1 NgoFVII family restriction endonuclease [Paracoccus shanxieyensis]MTH89096.1 NgoFVII family restriction endonuclease [Paracoccus shanxieyensis]